MIIEWPKETSTCNCLLRLAYKEFREATEEWIKRTSKHYGENPECFKLAVTNPMLLESKTPHPLKKVVASFWRVDEESLSEEWGIKSKGLNNVS